MQYHLRAWWMSHCFLEYMLLFCRWSATDTWWQQKEPHTQGWAVCSALYRCASDGWKPSRVPLEKVRDRHIFGTTQTETSQRPSSLLLDRLTIRFLLACVLTLKSMLERMTKGVIAAWGARRAPPHTYVTEQKGMSALQLRMGCAWMNPQLLAISENLLQTHLHDFASRRNWAILSFAVILQAQLSLEEAYDWNDLQVSGSWLAGWADESISWALRLVRPSPLTAYLQVEWRTKGQGGLHLHLPCKPPHLAAGRANQPLGHAIHRCLVWCPRTGQACADTSRNGFSQARPTQISFLT